MESSESKTLRNRNERILILLLSFVAAFRVLIFSAAFPFFSNVDEDLHFDLITQYSHGRPPRTFETVKEETLFWMVPYGSLEFLNASDQFPGGKFPPPLWKQSGPKAESEFVAAKAEWSTETNFESSQPPLYYIVASLWWWIGKHIGFGDIQSLYWIRFLNVPLMAMVVWLGYTTARIFAPTRVDLRLGVPLLLAFIPQNVFYAMNSDVLSPVCCGALFLCVLRWLRTATPSFLLGALTGLAIAAAYLTKLPNLPLIAVGLIAIVGNLGWHIRQFSRATFIAFAALVICSVIPIGSWMFWTKHQFGDLTGSTAKIALLGWTQKPFADWWQHPIFTPGGFWIFWSDLLASFWRGEVKWHGQMLRSPPADGFYAISSLALLVAALIGLRKGTELSRSQRQAISIAALSFIVSVGFLALLSIQFDFGTCINPSQAHPYFTSGRLLSGALIPFAVVYVYGIAYLFRRINSAVPMAVLALIIVFVTTSEIITNYGVFASEYNFFHI